MLDACQVISQMKYLPVLFQCCIDALALGLDQNCDDCLLGNGRSVGIQALHVTLGAAPTTALQ